MANHEGIWSEYRPTYWDGWSAVKRVGDLVRCRNCRHYSEHEWIIATDVSDVCHFWHGKLTKVEPDGFCAWGERKEVDA